MIALFTLGVSQFVRPAFRGAAQWLAMRGMRVSSRGDDRPGKPPEWFQRTLGDAPLQWSETDFKNIGKFPYPSIRLLGSPENGLFMRALQDAAGQILARPSQNLGEYRFLVEAASREDQDAVLWLDVISRHAPQTITRLLNPTPANDQADSATAKSVEPTPDDLARGFADAIGAAQEAVSTAASQRLDGIQVSLETELIVVTRASCVVIGVLIADLARATVGGLESQGTLVVFIVGGVGGLMAALAYDIAQGLMARRR